MFRKLMEDGVVHQTVLTTGFHNPNAAAVGLWRDGDELVFRVFEGSDTYGNLQMDRRFTVHMVPREMCHMLLTAALTGWGTGRPEFEPWEFDSFSGIPYLIELESRLFCRVKEHKNVIVEDDVGRSEALDIVGEVFKDDMDPQTEPIVEGAMDVVEAAVWATRWRASKRDDKGQLLKRARELLEKVNEDEGAMKEVVESFLKENGAD